jgi:hypothetical protein
VVHFRIAETAALFAFSSDEGFQLGNIVKIWNNLPLYLFLRMIALPFLFPSPAAVLVHVDAVFRRGAQCFFA